MELVKNTPPSAKRGPTNARGSFLFFEKVKVFLLRTSGAMRACPGATADESFAALDDLDSFADDATLAEVVKRLSGKETLAAKVFFSVTDDDERRQLELFGEKRKAQKGVIAMEELQTLVARAQALARELSSKKSKADPLIERVLALRGEVDDESGTGEPEAEPTSRDDSNAQRKRGRSEIAKEKSKPAQKKDNKKKGDQKKGDNKNKKNSDKKKKSDKKKSKQSPTKKSSDKGKEEIDVEEEGKQATEQEGAEVSEIIVEEDIKKPPSDLCASEVVRLLSEAEQEFGAIQAWQRATAAMNIVPVPPLIVQEVISGVKLEDVDCLCELDIAPLNSVESYGTIQMWWRLVKRACQIRGLFQLIRALKSKKMTIQERYEEIVAKIEGSVLCFAQASRYERLGKFLADFPLFVYQRKWVTLADWFQKIDGKVFLDCLVSIAPLSSVFMKDSFTLHEHGFQVYPGMMSDCITADLIEKCKTCCAESGEIVFNNTKKVDSRHNDRKRVQLSLEEIEGGEAMLRFKSQLRERLRGLFPRHKVDSIVALLSKVWCKAQLAHTDFSPKTLANVLLVGDDENMPLACLVALVDDTVF